MKIIAVVLTSLLCTALVCAAEPSPPPTPTPTKLRDLAPSEIDQLTLEMDVSSGQNISFCAFGTRYFISHQLIYTRDLVPHAAEIIAQFRAAKYISVAVEAIEFQSIDGAPELRVSRIQFHY